MKKFIGILCIFFTLTHCAQASDDQIQDPIHMILLNQEEIEVIAD